MLYTPLRASSLSSHHRIRIVRGLGERTQGLGVVESPQCTNCLHPGSALGVSGQPGQCRDGGGVPNLSEGHGRGG